MIRNARSAAAAVLAVWLPLAAMAAEPAATPGAPPPESGRPPASTQSAPTQPYDVGTPASPSTATTTDGAAPGAGGTLPPGSSPRDGAAAGRPAEDPVPPMFRELDTNRDGYISREEARRSADATARFDEMDTDHDGRISVQEWKAAEDRKNGR